MPNGERYLPDFYFPNLFKPKSSEIYHNSGFSEGFFKYAEIKPSLLDLAFEKKIRCFVNSKKTSLILLDGVPEYKPYLYIMLITKAGLSKMLHKEEDFCIWNSNYGWYLALYSMPYKELQKIEEDELFKQRYIDACIAAKSARFEFDERK